MSATATTTTVAVDCVAMAPICITERYRPEDCAAFVLLRQSGDVRLWQTTHTRASGHPHVEHHVTVGDESECSHVVDLVSALVSFFDAEGKQSARHDGFDDDRVFIVSSSHRRCTPDGHECINLWQACATPTFIIVGKHCTDAYINDVWESRTRFPEIELSELLAARSGALIELTRRSTFAATTEAV